MSDITTPAQPVKRKARTLEEREAALQAELNSLRAKARIKDEKKLESLVKEFDARNDRIRGLQAANITTGQEIAALKQRLNGDSSD